MKRTDLGLLSAVVYHVYKFTKSFRPLSEGSEAGIEFEDHLRTSLAAAFTFDRISAQRDLGLGHGLASRSGIVHEIDLSARLGRDLFLFEMKYYTAREINKEMVMVFHQKVMDFYLENRQYLGPFRIHRLFVTNNAYVGVDVRQFCAGWGILLLDHHWYPPPICEIIVQAVREEILCYPQSRWTGPDGLSALGEQAADLTARMWRSLDTIVSPDYGIPDILNLNCRQIPPRIVTAEWIAEHARLVRQIEFLKEQFHVWKGALRSV